MFYPSRLLAVLAPRVGRMTQSAYILGFVLPLLAVAGLSWLMFAGAPGMLGTTGYYAAGDRLDGADGDGGCAEHPALARSWQFGRDVPDVRPGVVLLPVLAFVLQFIVPAQLASAGDVDRWRS